MRKTRRLLLLEAILIAGNFLAASDVPVRSDTTADPKSGPAAQLYVLGPEDQVILSGPNAEDLVNKAIRIDAKGDLTVPLVGNVHAGGLTVHELEALLNQRLSIFVKNPQIVATVSEYRSQPVAVVGAVNSPGIHQIQGRKTLIEMLSLAGGPRPDAGSVLTLTRSIEQGPLPLPNQHLDASKRYSVCELNLRDITSGFHPDENIPVMPNDVLMLSRASTVYVIGDVKKAGGFPVTDDGPMTVIQALSLAQGAERTANLGGSRIIRNSQLPGKRQEIVCDLSKILKGQSEDIDLHPQDILYVPGSTGKRVALRALEIAISTGSGIAIWTAAR